MMIQGTTENNIEEQGFIKDLKAIVALCRKKAYTTINLSQVVMNWNIGRCIVEQEQNGKARAQYGKYVVSLASKEFTAEFGRGFSESNIRSFRRFYLEFKSQLSWSHYERLLRVDSLEAPPYSRGRKQRIVWNRLQRAYNKLTPSLPKSLRQAYPKAYAKS